MIFFNNLKALGIIFVFRRSIQIFIIDTILVVRKIGVCLSTSKHIRKMEKCIISVFQDLIANVLLPILIQLTDLCLMLKESQSWFRSYQISSHLVPHISLGILVSKKLHYLSNGSRFRDIQMKFQVEIILSHSLLIVNRCQVSGLKMANDIL